MAAPGGDESRRRAGSQRSTTGQRSPHDDGGPTEELRESGGAAPGAHLSLSSPDREDLVATHRRIEHLEADELRAVRRGDYRRANELLRRRLSMRAKLDGLPGGCC